MRMEMAMTYFAGTVQWKISGDTEKARRELTGLALKWLHHARDAKHLGKFGYFDTGWKRYPQGNIRVVSNLGTDTVYMNAVPEISGGGRKYVIPLLWPAYEVADQDAVYPSEEYNRRDGVLIAKWNTLEPLFFASYGTRRYPGPPTYQYVYDNPDYYEMPSVAEAVPTTADVPYPCNVVNDPDCQEWNVESREDCYTWNCETLFEYHARVHWELIMTLDGADFHRGNAYYVQDQVQKMTCCGGMCAAITELTDTTTFTGASNSSYWWAGPPVRMPFPYHHFSYVKSESGYKFFSYNLSTNNYVFHSQDRAECGEGDYTVCAMDLSGTAQNISHIGYNEEIESATALCAYGLSYDKCYNNYVIADYNAYANYSGEEVSVWGDIFYKWDIPEEEMEHTKNNEVMCFMAQRDPLIGGHFYFPSGAWGFAPEYGNAGTIDYHCCWNTDKHSKRSYDLDLNRGLHWFKEENGKIVGSINPDDKWESYLNLILVRLDKKFAKKKFGLSHVADADIQWID